MTLHAASAQAMRGLGCALGRALGGVPRSGGALVIGFEGELGAGKTTLVQGALSALGVTGVIRSPTYTLIEAYEAAGRSLYHLDLYRLVQPDEIEALGLRDLLEDMAVLLIEWPARGAGFLPPADLEITIEYLGDTQDSGSNEGGPECRDAGAGSGSAVSRARSAEGGRFTSGSAEGRSDPGGEGPVESGIPGEGRMLTLRAGSSAGAQLIERLLAATSQ